MRRVRVGKFGVRCKAASGKFAKCRGGYGDPGPARRRRRRRRFYGDPGPAGMSCVRFKRTRAGKRCAKYA